MTTDQDDMVLQAAAAILRSQGRVDLATAIEPPPAKTSGRPELTDLKSTMINRISKEIERQGLTPIKAATRVGLPRDTFRNMFRVAATFPRVDTLALMAKALNVRMAYLLGEEDRP